MEVDINRMTFNLTIEEMTQNKELNVVTLFKEKVQEVLNKANVSTIDRVQLAIILLVVEQEIKRTIQK